MRQENRRASPPRSSADAARLSDDDKTRRGRARRRERTQSRTRPEAERLLSRIGFAPAPADRANCRLRLKSAASWVPFSVRSSERISSPYRTVKKSGVNCGWRFSAVLAPGRDRAGTSAPIDRLALTLPAEGFLLIGTRCRTRI